MKVCLDACVLYPTVLREILTGCAEAGLFTPIWSARILEEWARATIKLGPGAQDVARGEIALMRNQFPKAEVIPRAGDIARLHLPDPDDIHVLAAAIAGGANVICTFNAKDFPRATLADEGLLRLDPDQLFQRFWSDAPVVLRDVTLQVHATAERLSGEAIPLRALLKRGRLPKLGKALTRT